MMSNTSDSYTHGLTGFDKVLICVTSLNIFPFMLNITLAKYWYMNARDANSALYWFLPFLKMLVDSALCMLNSFAMLFWIMEELSIYNNALWIFGENVFRAISAMISFTLKMSFIAQLERFYLFKYPLNHFQYFSERKANIWICICAVFDIMTFMITNDSIVGEIIPWPFSDFLKLFCDSVIYLIMLNFSFVAWRIVRKSGNFQLKTFKVILFIFGNAAIYFVSEFTLNILAFFYNLNQEQNILYTILSYAGVSHLFVYTTANGMLYMATQPLLKDAMLKKIRNIRCLQFIWHNESTNYITMNSELV